MGVGFGPQPYAHNDGLVLDLDVLNTRSYSGTGTSIIDLSGSGINGTINGSAPYSNGYLSFNGTNQWISLGNIPLSSPISLTSNFSIEAVFTPTAYQSTNYFGLTNVLFEKGSASTYNYAIQATNNTTASFIKRTGAESLIYHNFTVPSMQFQVNVLTFVVTSNTTVTCYLNNILIGSQTVGGSGGFAAVNNEPAGISMIDVANATRLIGKFYSMRIYNKALTAENISQNNLYVKHSLGIR